MKTSLYPNLIHLFAALQQMKHVRLSNSNYNILMACFMFDFQKTVLIVEKKRFFKYTCKYNLIQQTNFMCIDFQCDLS